MRPSVRIVLVANPANRRVAFFQAAVARAGLPPAEVVPWLALARGEVDLAGALRGADVLRLDSPGEDDEVERALIALGADAPDLEGDEGMAPRISAAAALALPVEVGRILHPRQWYLGFARLLERLARALAAAPPRALLNHPDDVAVLFDKRACHARLLAAGVPVPPALPGARVRGWDDLRARMATADLRRVFVKLAPGSSASGVVALETRPGRVVARTTAQLERGPGGEVRLFNSLRVQRYDDEADVAAIVDALCREGVHVEAWLPKAGVDGRTFDLRVVVIDGRARQVVVRTSQGPLTNLHLGNRRGDPAAVRALLGDSGWSAALATAEASLGPFPRSRYAGVDLLVGTSLRRFAVLELNAFGDLLPNVFHEGQDTHGLLVAAATGRALTPAPRTSPLSPHLPPA